MSDDSFVTPFGLSYASSHLSAPSPLLSLVDATSITSTGSQSYRPTPTHSKPAGSIDPLLNTPPPPISPFSSLFERFYATLCKFDRPVGGDDIKRNNDGLMFQVSLSRSGLLPNPLLLCVSL